MTMGHVFGGFVEFEFGVILVDSVVSQMHASLLHVVLVRGLVLLRRKATQSLVVEVEGQWVDTGH